MPVQEETNITNNQSQMFRPHLLRAKNVILGNGSPKLFTRIIFYIGILVTFIFGIWNSISYFILKMPSYLKQHKQVDVKAIVALRGRELGFEGEEFYRYLELFHFTAICLWFCVFIGFVFLWRQKKWSAYVIIGGLLIYSSLTAFLLGATYFVEDTTLFDKLTLLILLVLVLIHHFTVVNKKPETEVELEAETEDIETEKADE